ncbi:MAG: crossover junction endodeoxyribonuclease RuvC [Oscillospiraceae bacterium]|nr:crossover junction endodeoxyribonuclease RuvC [Oscillospiraceae bacterium]
MIILGIDPGYATIGYAVLEHEKAKNLLVTCGVLKTESNVEFPKRLEKIFKDSADLFLIHNPDVTAVESLYFQNNQKTAMAVAHARGVLVLAAQVAKVPIFEYTPLQVKVAMTGCGRAKKNQVMEMAQKSLNLDFLPKPDDAADAIAIAVCHAGRLTTEYQSHD